MHVTISLCRVLKKGGEKGRERELLQMWYLAITLGQTSCNIVFLFIFTTVAINHY